MFGGKAELRYLGSSCSVGDMLKIGTCKVIMYIASSFEASGMR